MSGSCHFDRASNVEIAVECKIFAIVIFLNCSRVLKFEAHSRHYKGALTQKKSFVVICTTFRFDFHVGWKNQNKHSTLNWTLPNYTHCLDLDLNGLLTRCNFWGIPGMLEHYTIQKWKEFLKSRKPILRKSYLSTFIHINKHLDGARGTLWKKS